jgi:hypothetical protein
MRNEFWKFWDGINGGADQGREKQNQSADLQRITSIKLGFATKK